MSRRRVNLDPWTNPQARGEIPSFDPEIRGLPILYGRLVRRGRVGALMALGIGLGLSAGGALGCWLMGPWNGGREWYPGWLVGSFFALAAGLWGIGNGLWFVFRPHHLAPIPDAKTFIAQVVGSPHPVTVCTGCRRLLVAAYAKSCDRCFSAADLFTAESEADHRVIFATLPRDP